MPFTTRLAASDDIPPLNIMIAQSVRGLSMHYYTAAQIESAIKYVFGVDTQLVKDGTYYVAEMDGKTVGCGGWSKRTTLYGGDQHKETEDPLLDPAKDAARIRAFFVHPDHARQGIGTHIINVCETAAKSNGFTCLELGATLPGVPLYTARGYQAVETIKSTLPNGVIWEIVRMRKDILP